MIRYFSPLLLLIVVGSLFAADTSKSDSKIDEKQLMDTVNSFFELVGKNKVKDAAEMTENKAMVTKQLHYMQALTTLHAPTVSKAYANEKVALIVTNTIQAQQVNFGSLFVNMKYVGGEWRIHDMHLESTRDVPKKIDRFKNSNPTVRLLAGAEEEADSKKR